MNPLPVQSRSHHAEFSTSWNVPEEEFSLSDSSPSFYPFLLLSTQHLENLHLNLQDLVAEGGMRK